MIDLGLLERVLENPDDDLARLLCADWLDERGEHERAEFIRVQVELAKSCAICESRKGPVSLACECGHDKLRARERLLLMHHFAYAKFGDLTLTSVDNPNPQGRPTMVYRRGFLHTIRCTEAEWQRWGERLDIGTINERYQTVSQAILREHPVERVELTDCGNAIQIHHKEGRWSLTATDRPPVEFDSRAALIDAMPQRLRDWRISLADPRLTAEPAMRWTG